MAETRSRLVGALEWLSERLNLTEIFSLLTSYGMFHAELDPRKPLSEALDEAASRPAPSYARWPRVLGLVVVVLIGIELLTGGLLALYYLPTPEAAHASLGTILRDVGTGGLVHQIHFWGAQVLLAVLLIRLARFFVQGLYRPPRELFWVFGALLLLVCFHLDLTGRALPMTTGAYWTSVRALEIVGAIPVYGSLVVFLLGGAGTGISDLTLIRFYVLHVAILPGLAVMLIYLHFSGVRRVGLAPSSSEPEMPGRVQFRLHVANLAIVLTVLIGVVVSLSVLVPVPFLGAADPYATPAGIGPPWYLLGFFGFLEATAGILPQWLAGLLVFLAVSAFVLLPFVDRGEPGSPRRRLALALMALLMIAWLLLTAYGARVV
jgi:quinol-cytochrome oxidoreductase complex cytochrome b subunit